MSFGTKAITGLLGLAFILSLPMILFQGQDYYYFQREDQVHNHISPTALSSGEESNKSTNVVVAGTDDTTTSRIKNNSMISTPSPTFSRHDDTVRLASLEEQERKMNTGNWETSIMITSNLIPTHPNIDMLKDTLHSLHKFLIGIPLDTPIYVVVDGLNEKKNTTDNQKREEEYIQAVRNGDFSPLTNVMVVPMRVHRNLAGSVKYTLEHYIETEFLYIIQHDLPFCNFVQHDKILQSMREHPDVLYNVRFRYNNKKHTRESYCYSYHNQSDFPAEDFNGLDFFSIKAWSDNNHLTTKKYYTFLLSRMKHHRRAMETVLGWKARWNCTYLGQQIYGRRNDHKTHICHLNGRVSQSYNDLNKANMTGWEKKAIWCRNHVYRTINATTDDQS